MIDVNELHIVNVTQTYGDPNEKSIDINFELSGSCYQLFVVRNEIGVFEPSIIFHGSNGDDCPYCDEERSLCSGLRAYKKDLFERLINHPSIRLEWLYLPHAVQA